MNPEWEHPVPVPAAAGADALVVSQPSPGLTARMQAATLPGWGVVASRHTNGHRLFAPEGSHKPCTLTLYTHMDTIGNR
jgi:hypothetical protein